VKTKTVRVDGRDFVIGKLTLDIVEEWETTTAAMMKPESKATVTDVRTLQRATCAASLARAGKTDPSAIGALDIDDLGALVAEVMAFSNMVGAEPGEAAGTP
jgi:hypothetical protein